MAIRDGKLYRQTHRTFALYCRERWEFTKTHANRLIQCSGTVANLDTHVCQKPNAKQAEQLAKAPADKQAEIWETVVEEQGDSVTAAKVRATVAWSTLFPDTPMASPAASRALPGCGKFSTTAFPL